MRPLLLFLCLSPLAAQASTIKVFHAPDLARLYRADPEPGHSASILPGFEQLGRRFLQPALAADEDLTALGQTKLVLLGRPAQVRWIEAMLQANRAAGHHAIAWDLRILHLDAKAQKRFIQPLLDKAARPEGPVVLAAGARTDKFFAALNKARGVHQVLAPRMLVLPFMRASMSVLRQRSYIKDYRTEFDTEGRPKGVEAIRAVAKDGVVSDIRSALLRKDVLGTRLKWTLNHIVEPIPKHKIQVTGSDAPLEIEVPKTHKIEIQADFELALGSTALLVAPALAGRHHVILLRAKLTDLTDEAAAPDLLKKK